MARKTPGIYIAIRGDYSAFNTDMLKVKQLAKAQAEDIAKSINNAVSAADLSSGIYKITRELKTAQAALSAGAFKGQVSGLEEIAKAAGVSSKQLEGLTNSMLKSQAAATANRAFEYLQKNAGLSTLELAKLRVQLGDTSGALSTLATGVKAHAVGMLAFGAAAAMTGKQVLDASLQMDRLNKAYATITGSSSAAQNQLDYMYDVTQRLGLQFQGTAEAAKGFFAAGKDSALKDHLNGIFESVSMAGSALALSKDQMDGVFLALGQMISKGKVQAEELRGQLGERLPGAFDMAAKAMGVTTAKLDDMLKKGQVTAEEMLPKLAKVLHDDFAVAAAEASQGLQGQLNRLSTEWTRFQASLLNGDAAAKVMKQLASGMKVLADHGAEIASIVGKGIQWAVWTAGVYAAIKALSGLGTAVTAAKAAIAAFNVSSVAAAVGSLSGLLGPAGLAAAAGAAIVAFTSLSSSTQSADDIFRKHQATIDDYKEKMGKATDAVKTFSEEQEKAYRRSLEQQRDSMKTDIAAAVGDVNSAVSGVQTFSLDNLYSSKAAALIQARKEVEELGRELAKLGQNVTQDDLNAYAEKVWAIDERMRGAGLATKEWNDMITNLVGEGDSFVLKMAAMIAKSLEIEGTLEQLRQTTANAKGELATGWSIGLEGVDAALDKLDTRLRTAQAKISNVKGMSDAAGTFKDFSVDQLEVLKKALDTGGRGALIKTLGEQYHVAAGQIQEVSGAMTKYFGRLKVTTEAEEKAAKIEEERRKKHSGKASAIEQTSTKLETLRKEVAALEEANIPAAKSFDQVVAKLELERKNAVATAEETAKLSVQRKQATATQATEQKALEIRKAELVYTQKLREAEAKRDDDLKKNADLRLDFEKRYADMVGLSSEAVSKSISKQAEEYRKAIEAGENAAEELVRLEEWKRDQIQRASREAMDGAQVALRDYQVEASNQAKSMNDAFRGLFSGMDSGWKSAWEQMIETGKVSLSSFRSVFASFLADLMHMALTRPITVQIAGAVSGMLGTGGVAQAAGGSGTSGSGGIMDLLSMGTSFLPGGSVTGAINKAAAWAAPSLFSTTSGYMEAAGTELLKAGVTGTAPAATPAPGTFTSAFGAPALGASIGSFASPYVNNLLGLQNNKGSQIGSMVGGLGTTAVLGTMAATNFWNPAGWVAGGLAALGSIFGGSIGSLFGGGRRTHASVYGKMEDVGFSRDQQTYIDAFMGGAWYDRAGKSEAEPFAQGIAQVASQTAGSLLDIAGALPEQIRQNALSGLETSTWSAGRGVSDASWNFQWWEEGMAEERLEEAAKDMRNQMTAVAQKVFADAGISQFFDTFDVTTDEGLQKASTALSAISAVKSATDAITSPLSEMEQQAQSAKAQLDAWTQGMKDSGVNAQYAAGLINEYRTAFINDYIKTLDESLHPLSAYEQAIKNANEAVDQRKKALEIIGATEGQLAQVEAMRAEVVKQATEEMLRSFDQSVAQRWAAVNGNSDEVGRAISQANELREAIRQFGESSAQVAELLKLHAAETAKAAQDAAESFRQTYAQRYATLTGDTNGLANLQQQASFASELAEIEKTWGKDSLQYKQMQALQDAEAAKQRLEQAQAAYDALQAQLEKQQAELKQLEQQAVQLQIEEIQKLQTASKERIAALEKELSAAQKLHDTWEDVFATAYAKRVDLYQGNTNLDVFGRLDTAQGEFDRLYGLAIGGDADAAKEMAGVASELLGLRGETTANRDDYLNAFYDVDKKLKEVSAYADAQVSDAQKQIDTLQAQLEAENAQYSILVSQLSAQQAALSALNGQTQTLASIQAQIAKLKTEINITIDGKNVASSTVGSAQGDYDDAKDKVEQTKPTAGIYGSKYLTEYDLLLAKAKALNRGENLADHQTAGGWTVSSVRSEIYNMGLSSVKEWYDRYGKAEGFERGGLAIPGGPKMFGERGIEYGDVEQPTRIYDATKTRLMLEGGHEYAQEAYKGMAEFSRMLARASGARGDGNKEETAALRKEVRELRGMLKAMLTSVVKNTKDARDFLEEFEETGLPPQRVNA